jgi:predicted helicase
VKFLRYGQHLIEKNGSGVLAFINPHGFLDNPTFRGMRWNLLKTYDKIYTIDLHGNSKKKETAPDGSLDINVFDIKQGVSINIFVKTGKKKTNELGKVFHYDLYGKRDFKYDFLSENLLKTIDFKELPNVAPNYFFVPKNFKAQASYNKGFQVNDLFTTNNVGIVTSRDSFVIDESKLVLSKRIEDFFVLEKDLLKSIYGVKENKSWKIDDVKKQALAFKPNDIQKISYRPFDNRFLYYNDFFVERSRKEVMQHFINGDNIGLVVARQCTSDWRYIFISKIIGEFNLTGTAGRYGSGNYLPLYLYPETNGKKALEQTEERKPNLNSEIVNQIAEHLGLTFTNEKETTENTFAPIDILDYIYAVLHSPTYREKYKEFLKIDFPRVPYPKDKNTFWELVKLGGEIRQIHLLESPKVEQYITQYPIDGDNIITRKITKNSPGYVADNDTHGKVYINDTQYFDNVPQVAWEFYIGGYQPAQKWLKDRKGRKLEIEDIFHYQKIIVALSETDRLMKEIDKIWIQEKE